MSGSMGGAAALRTMSQSATSSYVEDPRSATRAVHRVGRTMRDLTRPINLDEMRRMARWMKSWEELVMTRGLVEMTWSAVVEEGREEEEEVVAGEREPVVPRAKMWLPNISWCPITSATLARKLRSESESLVERVRETPIRMPAADISDFPWF